MTVLATFASFNAMATLPQTAAMNACNAADFQTTLFPEVQQASTEKVTQAVWLNQRLLKWPGLSAQGNFTLYASRTAQVNAVPGSRVTGANDAIKLNIFRNEVPKEAARRFNYVAPGTVLSVPRASLPRLKQLLQQQLVLVLEDSSGRVLQTTSTQLAGVLDDLYTNAANFSDLGSIVGVHHTTFGLWAPTAQAVSVCRFASSTGKATSISAMQRNPINGVWTLQEKVNRFGEYYSYLVDVYVPKMGIVRNRVTDPYSVSLNTDSKRSYIANLDDSRLKPKGWDKQAIPQRVNSSVDMVIYELHVRDFSLLDETVAPSHRGKFLAFTEENSNGMRHLKALSQAGMTDVHLLPIFDIATVPEGSCLSPNIALPASGGSESPQAITSAHAADDCYNWGYDPFHFNAPEGSYASDASDGGRRIIELRQMVMALHDAGLRVGMDVVYNHTTTSGQHETAVLDRVVPGYYHRLNTYGEVERSTCCDNTATENMMMGKLMVDSVTLWASQYKMDSFRFDLMAHQPRSVMESLQSKVNQVSGRKIQLIGEGWNFGEIANGARFTQASQLSLNGSGIATFSDRGRDAVRGGSAGDNGDAQVRNQGYINGLVYDPNALAQAKPLDLLHTADMVRVGLAGSIRDFSLLTHTGKTQTLQEIDYAGQPAGYVSEPGEVVNYVENHDNQTLYDNNVFKLPIGTSSEERARVQMLGVAINAFSQGVAYFHAGIDTLRSKSMDRNSFDSGDWFNRLDWTYQDNFFGTGLPPKADNGTSWSLMAPLLDDPRNKPTPADIALARDMFRDLLRIRDSSTLLRLRSAADIRARLTFPNTGPQQNPVVLVGHINGLGYSGAKFKELLYFINVDKISQQMVLRDQAGKNYHLHPVQASKEAADTRPRQDAQIDLATGRFTIPPRTAVVFVID